AAALSRSSGSSGRNHRWLVAPAWQRFSTRCSRSGKTRAGTGVAPSPRRPGQVPELTHQALLIGARDHLAPSLPVVQLADVRMQADHAQTLGPRVTRESSRLPGQPRAGSAPGPEWLRAVVG